MGCLGARICVLVAILVNFVHGESRFAKNFTCTVGNKTRAAYIISDCNPVSLTRFLPNLYPQNATLWPGRPRAFDVTPYEKNRSNEYVPGMVISILPPKDASLYYVRGYEVSLYKIPGNTQVCVVCNLSTVTWSAEDINTRINIDLERISGDVLYYMELYSLPKPAESEDENMYLHQFVKTSSRRSIGDSDPADWITTIVYMNISSQNKVEFSFSRPPESYSFQKFDVTLEEKGKNPAVVNKTEISIQNVDSYHEFHNIAPGEYRISIQPIDTLFQTSRCLCYRIRNGQRLCQSCAHTVTPYFRIYPAPTTRPPTTITSPSAISSSSIQTSRTHLLVDPTASDSSDMTTKIMVAVVGSVIGLVLVAILVFILVKRKRREEKSFEKWSGNSRPARPGNLDRESDCTIEDVLDDDCHNNERAPLLARKKVNLLFSQDYKAHEKVVENFANYLQTYCMCDVNYPAWHIEEIRSDGIFRWTINSIDNSDVTIVINSVESHQKYMSWKAGNNYQRDEVGPFGDMFTPGISHVLTRFMQQQSYKQYIMVHFEYTKEKFVLKDICPGLIYQLPKHFTELLCHIHGLNPNDDLCRVDLPLDGILGNTRKGVKLLEAVKEASRYEKENPDWFQFFQEDNYDSGIRVDSLSSDELQRIQRLCQRSISRPALTGSLLDIVDVHMSRDGSSSENCTLHPDNMSWISPDAESNVLSQRLFCDPQPRGGNHNWDGTKTNYTANQLDRNRNETEAKVLDHEDEDQIDSGISMQPYQDLLFSAPEDHSSDGDRVSQSLSDKMTDVNAQYFLDIQLANGITNDAVSLGGVSV